MRLVSFSEIVYCYNSESGITNQFFYDSSCMADRLKIRGGVMQLPNDTISSAFNNYQKHKKNNCWKIDLLQSEFNFRRTFMSA